MKLNSIHQDLLIAQQIAYAPSGLTLNSFEPEIESREYGACTCKINNLTIVFRVAKITPTKIGQFVTLWKRIGNGPIIPYDMTDSVDIFIVSARNGENFGQFIFPKDVLRRKGFISSDGVGGKRAIRVYPPWDRPESKQAQKTQSWQILYFVEIRPVLNIHKIHNLSR